MLMWTDCETTGLDERIGHLLEVALVVTDDDLNELAHTSVVICPPGITCVADLKLEDVVLKMHTDNDLLHDVFAYGMRRFEAELLLLKFVWTHLPTVTDKEDKIPLAGSTVGFDRKWIKANMPELEDQFSHRSVDVSSITELAKRWAPAIYEARPKAGKAHRALADVRESIEYLRYYRNVGFIGGQVS